MTNQEPQFTPTANAAYPSPDDEDEIRLTDLLLVILKRKKLILYIVFGAMVASVIISLLLPLRYTATARILPPPEPASGLSSLISQTGGFLGGLAGSFVSMKSTSDLYVGILGSRAVADILISKFKLQEYYHSKYTSDVYKSLSGSTRTQVDRKTQIISVSFEDKDPRMAADIANAYVEALDQINQKVNTTEGQRKRVFLENRLKKVMQDLSKAENDLKDFQEKFKLIAIDEQAKASIEGAAKIKAEIVLAEIQLEVMKQFGTEKQNEAVMLKSKIVELNKQLAKIEMGEQGKKQDSKEPAKKEKSDADNPDFYIPFKELPELGMQLARLMREAKIQEKVFELVTSQYELAKIEEAKDVNTIQFLDRAVPPDRKSSPKRSQIVVLTTVVAFFIAVFLAFFFEYLSRLKTEDPDRFHQLKDGLRLRRKRPRL